MSTLDVVADILREVAPCALKVRQIVELAGSKLPTKSRTPETVVSRDLAIDLIKHGEQSRFVRVKRGEYALSTEAPPSTEASEARHGCWYEEQLALPATSGDP